MIDDLSQAPTKTLINRASQGDSEASAALCARYLPRLTIWAHGRLPAYARGLKETDDLVQEALIGVVARLDVFLPDNEQGFLHYVRRSIRNNMLNQIRHAKVEERGSLNGFNTTGVTRTPLEDLVDKDSLERYERSLAMLSGMEQDLVIARLELDMSYKDIALHTGHPSADAARMAVTRAIKKLAANMTESQDEKLARK